MDENTPFAPFEGHIEPKEAHFGRKWRVFGHICSQCGCLFSDNNSDGLDICLTCGNRIRRAAGRDPLDGSAYRKRLIMAARQLDRKMSGQR